MTVLLDSLSILVLGLIIVNLLLYRVLQISSSFIGLQLLIDGISIGFEIVIICLKVQLGYNILINILLIVIFVYNAFSRIKCFRD